ncbi:HTH-type transcriptional regulator NorG [BD1-7 clade bacterium]|uniref:HTH-type transcriptional regulator NorG n=1 Tax=BD1-7 clade bacterium TaxID=2029982 RepID=A0A5S9PMX3_9GAMM|nr:HTH-type transcriptional regulator NorG [BD1-7 clade bacterium]
MLQRNTDDPLYIQLADQIIDDIQRGIYAVDVKVPSVRLLAKRNGVSISTVTQAYARLEDQGWISARPQSGFYVRSNRVVESSKMPALALQDTPRSVTKAEFINQMLSQLNSNARMNFGTAVADPSWMPQRAMQTHIQKVSRFQTTAVLDYLFAPGLEALRSHIAVRMRDANVSCHADDITITHGCSEALSLCLGAVTSPGDLIAVESPCYYGFLQIANMLGLKVIEIPTDPQQGVSLDALTLALEQWPIKAILIITRYSNPLGCCIPLQQQKRLVRLAKQHNVPIVEDDIYGEIGIPVARDSGPNNTVLKSHDTDGMVLYCSSFSKTMAAGLRVGWCLPGKWYKNVLERQTFTSFSAASLSQHAVLSYLQNGHYDKHLRQFRNRSVVSLQRFIDAIRAYFPPQTCVTEPQGGFILWVALPVGVSAMDLHYAALAHSIAVVPGDIFSNSDHFSNYLRINTAIPWTPDVDAAIKCLADLVKEQMQ